MKLITRRSVRIGAALAAGALVLSACSSEGGRQESSGGDGGGGNVDTPEYKLAMVTHAPEGDTFFDIIRAGADAAANKSGVTYDYSADGDPAEQAKLLQAAIDKDVDGIATSIPNAGAVKGVLAKAREAGIPVMMFNAGANDWQDLGALGYFGQDEALAGLAAGQRLAEQGKKKAVCVIQAQGQSQLEARCDGLIEGFKGGQVERLYVEGTDMPSVRSSIQAKVSSDKAIDAVMTLGAPFALAAVDAVDSAGSNAEVFTFDTNAELVDAIAAGDVVWAVDQQPYLQGYLAIDALWLYLSNGNTIGGGQQTLTGPSFVDESNVDQVVDFAKEGKR